MTNNKNKDLTKELVKYFRENREILRKQWIKEMVLKKFLEGLTPQEIETESTTIYDTCIDCLVTENYKGAKKYAQAMAQKGVLQGMSTEQIIGGMLTLRDVYGKSLRKKYTEPSKVNKALSIYEPVANKILSIVAMAFVDEKTKALEEAKAELEKKISERTKELRERVEELEKFSKVAVGRELKMVELKEKIKALENKIEELRR
ncbi:MAG: hypothetical protein KAU58_07025 [Candidatus Omnitrophica bacterium]|nr:hypothetical protein [Candidatus Omnitrophota bacterium]